MDSLLPDDLPAAVAQTAARVLLDGVADLEFDYAIPPGMEPALAVGSRVLAPLQKRAVTGTVLGVHPAEKAETQKLRPLTKLYDERPLITPKLLELGQWVSHYYCASMESVMRAMLPEAVRTDKHQDKTQRMVRLVSGPSPEEMTRLRSKAARQAEIIDALRAAGGPVPTGFFSASSLKVLTKTAWVVIEEEQVQRDPYGEEEFIATAPLELNDSQLAALEMILEAVEQPQRAKPVLLHGVTGSGKTEVYLQAAQKVLESGRGVLVLVPEISLTPQTVDRFKSRFAAMNREVAVLHSNLSQGERFDEWHRIQRGQARIVIGARSAVFAPLENIGLIIVDEEHENSYKQESPPRYHARDVAVVRAGMEPCAIVLGSATPGLESCLNAQRGKYKLVTMPVRADGAKLPIVRVIDMRLEKRRAGKGAPAVLSERLRIAIDQRLVRGEQSILFLNRRGFASSVQCLACGHVVKCNHCTVSMTMHRDLNLLVCHVCGFRRVPPRACPECKDPGILLAGFGTERVEETLRKVFPQARIARVDTDSMQQKNKLRDTLAAFKAHKLDVLVGTQMIAKGLHFPSVTLVGILNADLTLHIPDFRAGERTFSLLTQVAGRAGRGELLGEVVVQTFTPHSPSIQFARQHDYDGFSAQELELRRQCGYPPYCHAVLITCRGEHQRRAEFTLETLHKRLAEQLPENVLMGDPVPSPLERSHNQFRYQLLLRARHTSTITNLVSRVLKSIKLDRDVFVVVDVDPVSLA
ncbi:MAG TPA: primosomal protein N' [Verrucomicrobiales bacterium]|nr:primosomal protein N' [Verrucomicrobiales bacterium]